MTANAHESIEHVLAGRADLGVAVLDEVPSGLTTKRLVRVGQKVVVPSAHRLASAKRIHLRDLEGERLIVPPMGRPHRIMVARALCDVGVSWDVGVEVSGWDVMVKLVSLGFGVAIVNANVETGRGVVTHPINELPAVEYYGFWRNHNKDERIKSFLAHVKA